MSGKHDKSVDEDQSANLLMTGPIVIRGLGRSVKDAFRPGRPSRHRAFVGEEPEAAPLAIEAATPPGPAEQITYDVHELFRDDAGVPQTDDDAGPQEDRVDDRADDAPPADTDVEQPWDGTGERSAEDAAPADEDLEKTDESETTAVDLDDSDPDRGTEPTNDEAEVDTEPVVDFGDAAPVAAEPAEGEASSTAPRSNVDLGDQPAQSDSDADAEPEPSIGGSPERFEEPADAEDGSSSDTESDVAERDPEALGEHQTDVSVSDSAGSHVIQEDEGPGDMLEASTDEGLAVGEPAEEGDEQLVETEAGQDEAQAQAIPDPDGSVEPADASEDADGDASPSITVDGEPSQGEDAADVGSLVDGHEATPDDGGSPAAPTEETVSTDTDAGSEREASEPFEAASVGAPEQDEQAPTAEVQQPEDAVDDWFVPAHDPVEGASDLVIDDSAAADAESEDHVSADERRDDGPNDRSSGPFDLEPDGAEADTLVDSAASGVSLEADQAAEFDQTDPSDDAHQAGTGAEADRSDAADESGRPDPSSDADSVDTVDDPARTEAVDGFEQSDSSDEVGQPVATEDADQLDESVRTDEADQPAEVAGTTEGEPVPETDGLTDEPASIEPVQESSDSEASDPEALDDEPRPTDVDAGPSSARAGGEEWSTDQDASDAFTDPSDSESDSVIVETNDSFASDGRDLRSEESATDDAGDEADDGLDDFAFGDDPADADVVQAVPGSEHQEQDEIPAERDDEVLAGYLGQRGWTTAEELFSRPITLPATKEPDEAEAAAADGPSDGAIADGDLEEQGTVPDDSATDDVIADPEEPVDVTAPADEADSPPAAVDESSASDDSVPAEDPDTADEPKQVDDGERSEPLGDDAPVAPSVVPATAAAVSAPKTKDRPPRGPRQPRPRPVRERFGREAIGIAVLVVLALVCGGLITAVVLKTQNDARIAAAEAANYTPPPLATPTPAATGPVVAVIGDGSTSVAASGIANSAKWSALVGTSLSGTVTTDASSGMGYAAKGTSGETFVEAAAKVPSNADVVVLFGGAADSDVQTLSLAKAATDALAAVQKQAPDAKIIVVGPALADGVSSADLTVIRNTLHTAANIVKATWVDPIEKSWLSASKQAGAPSALTAADEKTIATKMEAAIKSALG